MGSPFFNGTPRDAADAAGPRDSRTEQQVIDNPSLQVLQALLVEAKKQTMLLLLLCDRAGVPIRSNQFEEI